MSFLQIQVTVGYTPINIMPAQVARPEPLPISSVLPLRAVATDVTTTVLLVLIRMLAVLHCNLVLLQAITGIVKPPKDEKKRLYSYRDYGSGVDHRHLICDRFRSLQSDQNLGQ